jgi:hypothetical protein
MGKFGFTLGALFGSILSHFGPAPWYAVALFAFALILAAFLALVERS